MNRPQQVLDSIKSLRQCFEQMAELEERLDKAIKQRAHESIQFDIEELYAQAMMVETLEGERFKASALLNAELGLAERASLKDSLPLLDDVDRVEFVHEYRALTAALMAVRSLSEGIDVYVGTQTQLLRSLVETRVPSSKSRLYGRGGALLGDRQPWLVSQQA